LGAFGIRPTEENDDGTDALRTFIIEIVRHLCDRATRREQETYHRYRIHDPHSADPCSVRDKLAEYDVTGRRILPPQETKVLVVWYEDDSQLRWSEEKGLVLTRLTKNRGAVPLTPDNVAAHYILLHTKPSKAAQGLFALLKDVKGQTQPPEVVSRETLIQKYGYPRSPSSDYYLLYHVKKDGSFVGIEWDIRKLLGLKGQERRQTAYPFNATLDEVMYCILRS
ncbi:MAG TPA: hypothetical protein PLG17_08535, partial [Thermodesulfobacteriota bacterium]|nr:hypothetical protein [Thermodesulfobacteriota bacterium]